MARSPKGHAPIQEESEAMQEQLSLFVSKNTSEALEEMLSAHTESKAVARSKDTPTYTAADIQVLEGIAAIRHRPGMYVGSTSTSGLLHLIWEALDNAVDEAVVGFGKHVWLSLDREGWVTVRDEGRGMPFDPMLY